VQADGPCPNKRNDNSVRLDEGKLMLWKSCDSHRHKHDLDSIRNKTGDVKDDTSPGMAGELNNVFRAASVAPLPPAWSIRLLSRPTLVVISW